MSKYILSAKQKSAVRAIVNAIKDTPSKYEKVKLGKVSYTGAEVTIFKTRAYYDKMAEKIFEQKTPAFSKKWKRSWNSIPTYFEIQAMAKKEYDTEINSLNKRAIVVMNKIRAERVTLNDKAMIKFYDALEKAKKSSKQTQNVKDLLAVENIIFSKMSEFYSNLYEKDSYKQDYVKDFAYKFVGAFDNKETSLTKDFGEINSEDIGYRKECLDMRGSEQSYASNSFCWMNRSSKEMDETIAKVEEEKRNMPRDNQWYKKYVRIQNEVEQKVKKDFTVLVGKIRTYAEGIDTYEVQRGDAIHTLNMDRDANGVISYDWDNISNDSWDYIPKGYELITSAKVQLLFAYMSRKTRSFITDDRKLKTLEKNLISLRKDIEKFKALQKAL